MYEVVRAPFNDPLFMTLQKQNYFFNQDKCKFIRWANVCYKVRL